MDLRERLQNTLGPAYTFEHELGGGGMSRVFVATETALGRKVVLKFLSHELAGGLSTDRFNREIQLVAGLQHPNIVPLLAAGDAGGVPYYSMPLVEGESLRARLQRVGELPIKETVAVLRDVGRALDYAHARGVVHRDIKPDNVLLSSDYALVTDFGVAKALIAARSGSETLTEVGVALGTPAYMAPEQAAGEAVDHRADIYAFGCVAYELLTGAPPFGDKSAPALFAAHATRSPVPLTEVRPTIPAALAALVMRCLEKRPADRPQSAREVVEALDAVSMPAPGSAAGARTRYAGRRPYRLVVSAAVGVALVVTAVVLVRRGTSSPLPDNVIAVTPFRVAGADPSLSTLREGMLDLIAAKLSGNIHSVDQRTLLNKWRTLGGSEMRDLSRDGALELSAQVGAGRLLQGEIVGTVDDLRLNATLVNARDGQNRAIASARGKLPQLAVLVDSLVTALFVREAGGSEKQARQLAGVPFNALQSYLAGQSLYRRGRYTEAEREFLRALDFDSTFGLAGLQLFIATGWTGSSNADRGLTVALRAYDELGPLERIKLRGADPRWLRGYRLDCREMRDAGERAVAQLPDQPESWYFFGDPLFHCGWVTTAPGDDPFPRALAAFERGTAIDSTFVPLRIHMPWLYLELGDTARALATLALDKRDSVETADASRYMLGLMTDSGERSRFVARLVTERKPFALFLPDFASFFAVHPEEVDGTIQALKAKAATDPERLGIAAVERSWALNRGQPKRAAVAAREGGAAASDVLIDFLFWDGDSTAAATMFPIALRDYAARPVPERLTAWRNNVFAAAQYSLNRGDTALATRASALLRGVTGAPDRPWDAARSSQLALMLDAQLAARSRRSDALLLLSSLDSLTQRGPPGWPLSIGPLIASRLWQRRGDPARAYAAIQRVVPDLNLHLTTYRLERARIAASLGKTQDAIRQYQLYLALRYDPEPALASQVASVRSELDRLRTRTR